VAQFTVRPGQLMNSARSLDAAAQDFGTRLNQVQATITSGNPWGGDEPGTLFGMAYTALLGHALEAIASHGMKIEQAAAGLAATAEAFSQTESHATQRLAAVKAV
jgi:hypothetical protein